MSNAVPTLLKNGLPQEFIVTIPSKTPGAYIVGTANQTLTAVVPDALLKFRYAGGTWATISNPTITYDITGQCWIGYIPATNLINAVANSNAQILITSPSDVFSDVKIFANIGVNMNIVPSGAYTLSTTPTIISGNACYGTITLTDTTITKERIINILDVDNGISIYNVGEIEPTRQIYSTVAGIFGYTSSSVRGGATLQINYR